MFKYNWWALGLCVCVCIRLTCPSRLDVHPIRAIFVWYVDTYWPSTRYNRSYFVYGGATMVNSCFKSWCINPRWTCTDTRRPLTGRGVLIGGWLGVVRNLEWFEKGNLAHTSKGGHIPCNVNGPQGSWMGFVGVHKCPWGMYMELTKA